MLKKQGLLLAVGEGSPTDLARSSYNLLRDWDNLQNLCSHWIPYSMSIAQQKARRLVKKCSKNTMAVFRNTSFFCSRTKHFQTMDMSQSYHYNNSKQSMLNGTQPFFCQLPSKKSRKPKPDNCIWSTQNNELWSWLGTEWHFIIPVRKNKNYSSPFLDT